MYKQIKQLADDALALQNKIRMDEALREISSLCEPVAWQVATHVPSETVTAVVDDIGEALLAIDAATREPGSTVDINDIPALVDGERKKRAKKGGTK